ncbi:MAG: AgmX/PglI C-terminal domain-containing protein, partial [Deltaproteobacteria bacterium]
PGAEAGTETQSTAGGVVATPGATFNEQIADTVRGRVGEIRGCYQTQLARSADLQLRTHVRFTIEPAGRVPTASSTTVVLAGEPDAATAVAQCVEGIVRATAFPARTGGAALETSLPFSFSPGAGVPAGGGGGPATGTPAPTRAAAATGRIDAARTGAVIRANTDQVRACYTRALQVHPDLSGRVMVRFTVDTSGRVTAPSSQVTPISGDRDAFDAVATCIESVLTSLTLPPPTDGPAAVALPFDFSPNAL